jgi:hypothetical protein
MIDIKMNYLLLFIIYTSAIKAFLIPIQTPKCTKPINDFFDFGDYINARPINNIQDYGSFINGTKKIEFIDDGSFHDRIGTRQ